MLARFVFRKLHCTSYENWSQNNFKLHIFWFLNSSFNKSSSYLFLVNDQRDAQFFTMYLFLFLTLYMFRAHCAHHQERHIVSIQPLVTVTLFTVGGHVVCRSEVHFRPAHDAATDTDWQLREVVLTQFVSPDDEHDVFETCRELKIKINT
jgi:hypothetical protein